jgi:amidohydrolase
MKTPQRLYAAIDALAEELWALSSFIHANPELGHQEVQAQARLVSVLRAQGFAVEEGVGGFPTAFRARFAAGSGPLIAFLAEYDALPGLGHGCGHNLICAAAVGAAWALKDAMEREHVPGTVIVVGTPAEEVPPPVKGLMAERGVFDGTDVAMIAHGRDRTCSGGALLAVDAFDFTFRGRAAHAAANPEDGISALDAALLTMHAVEMLREHVRSDVRIHGIITDGGQAPNVVPDRAALRYYVRALDRAYVEQVSRRVEGCARAGALATGAELTVTPLGRWEPRRNVEVLNQRLLAHAAEAGAERIGEHPPSLGSADFGNLSQRLPAATLYVELVPPGVALHTPEVVRAAGGEPGRRALLIGAKALAATGYDLLTDPPFLAQIQAQFAQSGPPAA